MANRIKSFIVKTLNVGPAEAPHVMISWFLGFIGRVSFVLGWTILIVFFVSHYGISSLPYLFVTHAFGIILGSLIFGRVSSRFKKSYLMIGYILASAIVLAMGAYFYGYSDVLFLTVVFVSLSLFLSQYKIAHNLFIEELFTPTQSNRVFPIVESAETFGLIVGGILVSVLAPVLTIHKFLYVWMLVVLMGIPAIIFYLGHSINYSFKDLVDNKHRDKSGITQAFKLLNSKKQASFLKAIILIIFLQWTFFSILEFQYTKAIDQHITHSQEDTLLVHEVNEFGKASVVIAQGTDHDSAKMVAQAADEDEAIIVQGQKYEENLASDLGLLQALFGSATLLFQLVLASRILSSLGVVGTMLVSPLAMIISAIWMTINYGFGSAVLARFNHEVTHVLHNNAYHSSYYALNHESRASVMELIEGFVRPLGSLGGTAILLLVTNLLTGASQTVVLNFAAIVIMFVILMAMLSLRNKYNAIPKADLMSTDSLNVMVNAIDIIAQNGRADSADFLVYFHRSRAGDLPRVIQELTIKTIGELGNEKHVPYLIELAYSSDELMLTTLHAVNEIFSRHYLDVMSKPFTWHALKSLYDQLLSDETDRAIRDEVITFLILSNYHEGFVDKALDLMKSRLDDGSLATCINLLKDINDYQVVNMVKSFDYSNSPILQSAMINVRWIYEEDHHELIESLRSMLLSNDEDYVGTALLLAIKLELFEELDDLIPELRFVYNDNVSVKFLIEAYLYLAHRRNTFIDFLHDYIPFEDLEAIDKLVKDINKPIITKVFRRKLVSDVHDTYLNYKKYVDPKDKISVLQGKLLDRLRLLYKLLGANKEFFIIEEILLSEGA